MKPLSVDDIRIEDPDFYFEGRRDSYERLHAECPVFYYEPLDVFVLTKHEDIKEAARRPEITPFTSRTGFRIVPCTAAVVSCTRLTASPTTTSMRSICTRTQSEVSVTRASRRTIWSRANAVISPARATIS